MTDVPQWIFHVTTRAAWEQALEAGSYEGDTLATEGFIHCSTEEQLPRVVRERFAGRDDLVVLRIDPRWVLAEIRRENLEGGDEPFPHIYGALDAGAVNCVFPLVVDAAGEFEPLPWPDDWTVDPDE